MARRPLHKLRTVLGTMLYDWPRFLHCLAFDDSWAKFHNRNERVTIDPVTRGVACEWEFTSDLHLCNVFPATARWLLSRAIAQSPIEFAREPRLRSKPLVSFIVGHRGTERVPHLMATLATLAAQCDVAIECIVIEQSTERRLPGYLPDWVRYIHTPIASNTRPYNRSWAFNVGAKASRGAILVLHDNDFLIPASYASTAVHRLQHGADFANLKRFMFYLDKRATDAVFAGRFPPDRPAERVTQNALGGSIVALRSAYFEIGGFDETFEGWGGEDNEFWSRAATRSTNAFGTLPLVHLWHPPQPEKLAAARASGRLRYEAVMSESAYHRIRRLRSRSFGCAEPNETT